MAVKECNNSVQPCACSYIQSESLVELEEPSFEAQSEAQAASNITVSSISTISKVPIPGMVELTSASWFRASAMTTAKPLESSQFMAQTLFSAYTYFFKWKSMWLENTEWEVYNEMQREYTRSPVKEPWSSIVRDKTYRHVIPCSSHTYRVSPDWVNEVRCRMPRNSNNGEIVLSSLLEGRMTRKTTERLTPWRCMGC